jgi:broad specificity phosphatase PhoE
LRQGLFKHLPMKTIEIHRHSIRTKPGQNLSQQGVTLARLVGESMGKFDRVVTSNVPRAFQTAIAMGYAVDEEVELIATFGDDVESECPWPASFADYAAAYHRRGATYSYAQRLAGFYVKLAESLPESGSALVINHGGIVEMSAVGCLPSFDHSTLGDYCECCEGVRLTWDGGKFVNAEVLRV